MTYTDYADDFVLLTNTPAQVESLLHSLGQVAKDNGLYVKANETELMHFKQKGTISTLSGKPLKSADQFRYIGSNISSTESDVNICLVKVCNAIHKLLIIWKCNLSDKMRFLPSRVHTTMWMHHMDNSKMYREKVKWEVYKSAAWKLYLTKQQLYSYLPSISQTIPVRQTRHSGHCWRSKDKLISNVLLWTSRHGHANDSQLAKIYISSV